MPPASSLPRMDSARDMQDARAQPSRLTHEDAMDFLDRVREVFSDRPFIYNNFLAVMKEFKDQTISTDGVINRVKLFFKGHPDLLQGFNLFLPPAYRINVEAESPPNTAVAKIEDQKAQQFAAAYQYVTKVKERFVAAPHTYKEFLTVLGRYDPPLPVMIFCNIWPGTRMCTAPSTSSTRRSPASSALTPISLANSPCFCPSVAAWQKANLTSRL